MSADNPRDIDFVLRTVEERDIRFIRLWFTDVLGFLKSFAITPAELEIAFEEGMGFDGSAIEGFARGAESDMLAKPDPATFTIVPWRPDQQGVAKMICDITTPDGEPSPADPRAVLRRVVERSRESGFEPFLAPELEYFYFADQETTVPLDRGGYFDLTPLDVAGDLRKRTVMFLEQMGISVQSVHHEVAPSQHEIVLRATDAVTCADDVMTARLAVKEVAQTAGIYATFMPKPIEGAWGSGMHTHLSLYQNDSNALADSDDPLGLSKVARSFIAGVLAHAPGMTVVLNQWVNSYKRLVPGFEAPTYACWARRNRSALLRVTGGEDPGIEIRSPDPACNPYLAFAALIGAGLQGVSDGLELPPEADDDVATLSSAELRALGMEPLPGDLHEAVYALEADEVIQQVLGEHVTDFVCRNKREEWKAYQRYVSPWELDRNLPIL
ncbi:MAG: glutamine synthetase family protein [Actinomycetota bacterium]